MTRTLRTAWIRPPFTQVSVVAAFGVLLVLSGCGAINQQARTSTSPGISTAAVTGSAAAAWANNAPKPKKHYVIGVALPNMPDPSWQTVWYGIQHQCSKLGLTCRIADAGGYGNLNVQIGQIEDYQQAKVDGIIIGATDFNGVVPAVKAAAKSGIKLVDAEVAENSGLAMSQVINNQADIGGSVGDSLCKALNGAGGVLMLDGTTGNVTGAARANGVKSALQRNCPAVKIIGEQFSNADAINGLNITQDFLQSHPGQIQGIYTFSAVLAGGVESAISNRKPSGHIYIGTAGANPAAFDQVHHGTLAMIADQENVMQGEAIANVMVTALNGSTVPKLIQTPIQTVTTANVSAVDLSVSLAPAGWKP